MDEVTAVKLLKNLKTVFDQHGIEFWLDSGTLLGATRDGKIIPWDSDIDLGCWEENLPFVAEACVLLRKSGVTTAFHKNYVVLSVRDCVVNLSLYKRRNGMAIKPWGPKKYLMGRLVAMLYEKVFWGAFSPQFGKIRIMSACSTKNFLQILHARLNAYLPKCVVERIVHGRQSMIVDSYFCIPAEHFDELASLDFYGMSFKVPSDTKGYLEFRYGKHWMETVQDWQTERDDGALIFFREGVSG